MTILSMPTEPTKAMIAEAPTESAPLDREKILRVLAPFAALGECISNQRSGDRKGKDTSVFVGQVLRGENGEPDKHHPITFGDLRAARDLSAKLREEVKELNR